MKQPTWWVAGLFVLSLSLQAPLDNDLGWHLATGREILATGAIPREFANMFAVGEDQIYLAHSWLQDVLLVWSFQLFGWVGVSVLLGMIVTAAGLIIWHSLLKSATFLHLTIFGLVWWWGLQLIGLRTHGVTFLGLVLIYVWLLERLSDGRYNFQVKPKLRWSLSLLVFFLIWSQMHAGVITGLAFALLVVVLVTLTKRDSWKKTTRLVAPGLITAGLVTLLTPQPGQLFNFIWELSRSQVSSQLNQDWAPLLSASQPVSTLGWRLSVIVMTLWAAWQVRANRRWLLIICLVLTLYSQRFLLWLLVVLIPVLVTAWTAQVSSLLAAKQRKVFILSALVLVCWLQLSHWQQLWCVQQESNCYPKLEGIPVSAIIYLEKEQGWRVYNLYDWGGYLVWRLPQHRWYIDGRLDNKSSTTGQNILLEHQQVLLAQPGWQDLWQDLGIDAVLVPESAPVYAQLLEQNWQPVDTTVNSLLVRSDRAETE